MMFEAEDELLSSVERKLFSSINQYNPSRGSAFSFVSKLTVNMLATGVTHSKKMARRYPALEPSVIQSTPDESPSLESNMRMDDLVEQIRSIKSQAALESERQAQKWYVESFIDSGFEMRRHQCADAAQIVFGLGHRRSRQLYDLTLLEIRRTLWAETRHAQVNRSSLKGTKGLPLLRYVNFLSPQEFSQFAALMKDLAPYLVILIRPQNEGKIRAGVWSAVRENLELILGGVPEATPLYDA